MSILIDAFNVNPAWRHQPDEGYVQNDLVEPAGRRREAGEEVEAQHGRVGGGVPVQPHRGVNRWIPRRPYQDATRPSAIRTAAYPSNTPNRQYSDASKPTRAERASAAAAAAAAPGHARIASAEWRSANAASLARLASTFNLGILSTPTMPASNRDASARDPGDPSAYAAAVPAILAAATLSQTPGCGRA